MVIFHGKMLVHQRVPFKVNIEKVDLPFSKKGDFPISKYSPDGGFAVEFLEIPSWDWDLPMAINWESWP